MTNEHDRQLEAELNRLRKDYEQLRDLKVGTERDIDNLTAQLDNLKAQAREEYGTDDPQKLAALLEEKREENQRLVEEYRNHLQAIRKGLDEASGTGGSADGESADGDAGGAAGSDETRGRG